MKLKPLFLIALFIAVAIAVYFISCVKNEDNETVSRWEDDFLTFIYSAYQVDGKYYLSGCSHWFGELEREIKEGDSFRGKPDHHCGTTYTVEKLDKDSIYLSCEIKCYLMSPLPVITRGAFSIPCQKERAIAPEIQFEGEEIDSMLAKKHIAEGRIYQLVSVGTKATGNYYDSDSCRVLAEEKFGFKEYAIEGCMPLESQQLLLRQYNDTVYDFLKKQKGCQYSSAYELTGYFGSEVVTCRHEKAMRNAASKSLSGNLL